MSQKGRNLFRIGLKRRIREVRRMRIIVCLAVFFLAFTLLLQDNLGAFQMELNYRNYGKWFAFCDDGVFSRYPYLEKNGQAYVGSFVYSLYPISYSSSEGIVNDLAPTVEAVDANGDSIKEKPPISDDRGSYLPPSSQITVESFGDRRSTNCHIGAYSEGFVDQNGISLYEGRMPQADSEIVMELGVLHALGASYELGQRISFYVSETEPLFEHDPKAGNAAIERSEEDYYLDLHLVSFTLVGTLKRYTARWSEGSRLPGAIITENAFRALPSFENTYDFYSLKDGVGGDKVWEFAQSSFEGFRSWRDGLYERMELKADEKGPVEAWNSSAYTNPLWGSSSVYRYVTVILLVMSTCILAYLMASYLSKRRQFFMRMREIGATSGEVFGMAAYEWVLSALPFAAAALIGAYLAGFAAAFIVSKSLNISFNFNADHKTLLVILGAVLAMLAVSLAAAFIIYSGRGITEKKKALSKHKATAIRKRAAKEQRSARRYLSLSETLKRDRRIHPLKTALVRIACILIGAMILTSFMSVYAQTHYYLRLKNSPSDLTGSYSDKFDRKTYGWVDTEPHWNVTGSVRIDTDKADLSVSRSEFSFQNLLHEAFFAELEAIPGVKSIIRCALDVDHTLFWSGKENDAFIEESIMRGLDSASAKLGYKLVYTGKNFERMREYVDNSLYMLQCSDNTDAVWNAAKPYLGKEANRDAFLRGEQAIVFVDQQLYCVGPASDPQSSEYALREDYASTGRNIWKEAPSFSAGNVIQINDLAQSGNQTAVTVAAVLPMSEYVRNDICPIYGDEDMPVFITVGSMELAKRVQAADGAEFGANAFGVKLDSIAESDNAVKFISALCVKNNVRYTDTIEDRIESRNYWIDALMTYGFFTAILLVLYAFIFSSIAKEDDSVLANKYALLHRVGMELPRMKAQKRLDALIQSLWQLLSVPLYALIHFAPNLIKLGENAARMRLSRGEYLMQLLRSWFTHETTDQRVILAVMLALMLLLFIINGRLGYPAERKETLTLNTRKSKSFKKE